MHSLRIPLLLTAALTLSACGDEIIRVCDCACEAPDAGAMEAPDLDTERDVATTDLDGGVDAQDGGGAESDAEPLPERGPRALPPTFVPLELEEFPRPAREACAAPVRELTVEAGGRIADALAAATPGTTIWVTPGEYEEQPGDATALEWSTDAVCLRAAEGGTVVLQASAGQRYGISPRGSGTVIEGFELRGFQAGVGFWTQGGATQRSVTLERVRVTQLQGAFREGVVAYGDNGGAGAAPVLDGLLLLDVEVEGADLGVSCNAGPCAHWWVEGSRIACRGGAGGSGSDALAIEEGRQIVVLDTTVDGAAADGIDTKADEVVVFGAQVHDVARNGVKLWRGGDVIDTVVDGSGADAALVGDRAGRYRYLHVLVMHHGAPGDRQYVGTWAYDHPSSELQLEVVNSIFASNATGGLFAPAGAAVSIRSCLFDDPDAKLLGDDAGGELLVRDLAELEAQGRGQDNRIGEAGFVAPQDGDYSTEEGSPARDSAERIDGLTRDLLGRERVLGAGPDRGPVESITP